MADTRPQDNHDKPICTLRKHTRKTDCSLIQCGCSVGPRQPWVWLRAPVEAKTAGVWVRKPRYSKGRSIAANALFSSTAVN